jgi:hypothetical protein
MCVPLLLLQYVCQYKREDSLSHISKMMNSLRVSTRQIGSFRSASSFLTRMLGELEGIREAGTWKTERVIKTAQG